jgi:hypothetical protein
MKELKIEPPEGYEVDKEHSTFECIKFKLIKSELPTTWEEFCKTHPIKQGECYISPGSYSNITLYNYECQRHTSVSKSVLPSKEYAETMLALCQLIQLRECYNDGWKPDWTNSSVKKYCIYPNAGSITTGALKTANEALFFKTEKLMNEFLKNFRDLIEIAKPLL